MGRGGEGRWEGQMDISQYNDQLKYGSTMALMYEGRGWKSKGSLLQYLMISLIVSATSLLCFYSILIAKQEGPDSQSSLLIWHVNRADLLQCSMMQLLDLFILFSRFRSRVSLTRDLCIYLDFYLDLDLEGNSLGDSQDEESQEHCTLLSRNVFRVAAICFVDLRRLDSSVEIRMEGIWRLAGDLTFDFRLVTEALLSPIAKDSFLEESGDLFFSRDSGDIKQSCLRNPFSLSISRSRRRDRGLDLEGSRSQGRGGVV